MRLDAPIILLALIVLLIIVLFVRSRVRTRASLRFSTTREAKKVSISWKQRLLQLPLWLRVAALVLIAVAIARPQEGRERVRDISKGVAIEMVVDRSGSMAAEMDYDGTRMTRLDVVKKVFEQFVSGDGKKLEGRPNDLIGMITFARFAETACPLTLGHGALSQFLESVQLVKRRDEDGTAIGDAIALAAARLKTAEETLAKQTEDQEKSFEIKSKIIILLTDGQNNAGKRDPLEAAELAKEWGIKIYTIGVGGDEGLVRQNNLFGNFLMRMGQGVDDRTLRAIAESTDAMYRTAQDAESLRAVYAEIDKMEKSEVESLRFLDYKEHYQPFVLCALILVFLEIALSNTVFRKIP